MFVFRMFYFFCYLDPFCAFLSPIGLFFVVGVGSENFFALYVYRLTTFFSKYCSMLVLSCSLSLWWGGGVVFSDYRVSPNFFVVLGLR